MCIGDLLAAKVDFTLAVAVVHGAQAQCAQRVNVFLGHRFRDVRPRRT